MQDELIQNISFKSSTMSIEDIHALKLGDIIIVSKVELEPLDPPEFYIGIIDDNHLTPRNIKNGWVDIEIDGGANYCTYKNIIGTPDTHPEYLL